MTVPTRSAPAPIRPPPRPAQLVGRLATYRAGRVFLCAGAAGGSGALAFAGMRMLGASRPGAWLAAGAIAAIYFAYLLVFVKLRVLHYFGRRYERFIDRAVLPMVAVILGAVGLATAPTTVMGVVVLAGLLGMACYLSLSRKHRGDQLRTSAVYPRSSRDARAMLALARSLPPRRPGSREQFFVQLNSAYALATLAESEDTYGQLQEAYELLYELARSSANHPPDYRIAVVEGLVEVTSTLHRLGDDLRIYEEAAMLLDRELSQSTGVPDGEFRRLLNRSDVAFMRSGIPALQVAPAPQRTRALQEAVAYLRQAMPVAPRRRRVELHFRLAVHLAVLADWLDDQAYLAEAITQARWALQAVDYPTRERRPAIQLVLADMLTQLVAGGGAGAEALAEAEQLANAVRSVPDPETRAQAWLVLIPVLRLRHGSEGASPAGGIDGYVTAAYQEAMAPAPYSRSRLRVAGRLGQWAAEQGQPAGAAWAYGEALATARRLSAAGLVRRQQQGPLAEVRGLAAEAAHWLLASGAPHQAVAALESSRALVLGAAVSREVLISRLQQRDPRLARQCAELSGRLARADPGAPAGSGPAAGAPTASGPAALLWSSVAERRAARMAHEQWRRLASWLSQWPEFQALLQDPEYGQVAAAAQRRPLVYLAAAAQTGYALIVEPAAAGPRVVRLPELTSPRVRELADDLRAGSARLAEPLHARTQWRDTLAGCLGWLRHAVMRPLAGQLPRTGPVSLIPVGDLSLLPLHAAAAEVVPGLVWTYAPSAQVLGHAAEAVRQRPAPPAARALLVTMSGGGAQQLRYARSVAPVLRRHLAAVTQLDDRAAVREAVLATLDSHALYHFACHGAADGTDPLASHLQLADGRLTVRDLLDRRVRARLAVLAACETGVPYAQLPDEAIGLPAALLEAGVPGVVGTLWPVEELPTLLLTARFYELWLGRGMDPAAALHHAQRWLRSGTAGELETYAREWVDPAIGWPVRTAGRARQRRIFAHPDCWAAFAYTGV